MHAYHCSRLTRRNIEVYHYIIDVYHYIIDVYHSIIDVYHYISDVHQYIIDVYHYIRLTRRDIEVESHLGYASVVLFDLLISLLCHDTHTSHARQPLTLYVALSVCFACVSVHLCIGIDVSVGTCVCMCVCACVCVRMHLFVENCLIAFVCLYLCLSSCVRV